ncbi:MAG: energy transducer TonB [Acidobacteria bacterium]|nr:energy transducer TonB [Acidobacteriota bacterium]
MSKKTAFVLISVLALFSVRVFSQEPFPIQETPPVLIDNDLGSPEFYRIGDITGNIGEAKAVILAKPTYSNEAKEAGAEGKVKVQIEIDEDGGVTSAKAVSGHQLLYEAAQTAALKSKFLTPKINGQREKTSGYLNYNFLIEMPNWFKVGYDLALVEKVPTIDFLQTAIIKKAFQPDWQTENDLILQLAEIKRANPNKNEPLFVNKTVINSVGRNSASQRGETRLNIPQQNYEQVSVSQNLISHLRGRLGNDEKSLWQFNLGVDLIKFQELFRNPKTRPESFEFLRRFVQDAPADIQPDFLQQLKNLINLLEQKSSEQGRIEIGKIIARLQKIK